VVFFGTHIWLKYELVEKMIRLSKENLFFSIPMKSDLAEKFT